MIGVFSISPLEKNCLLERTLPKNSNLELNILYNNKDIGLSKFYNSVINNQENDKYEAIICCHDDISLRFANLTAAAKDSLINYDVVGVAGGVNPKIVERNLWHWMVQRDEYRGIAAHGDKLENMYVTSFGNTPANVQVLDGVFLMFRPKRLRESNARFDESFIWHHYDIDFSLTCNKQGVKLGVWPILIYHQSPGLRDINDPKWVKSNDYFKLKWK
jgi:GT2 family glycosyltransferase